MNALTRSITVPPRLWGWALLLLSPGLWAACASTSLPVDRPDSRYSISTDGLEVTDTVTRLIWRRCVEGMSWDAANATCSGAASAFSWGSLLAYPLPASWRLPNLNELASLASKACASAPMINSTLFPATPAGVYLSNTAMLGDGTRAWTVNFSNGATQRDQVSPTSYLLRLVKDAP